MLQYFGEISRLFRESCAPPPAADFYGAMGYLLAISFAASDSGIMRVIGSEGEGEKPSN